MIKKYLPLIISAIVSGFMIAGFVRADTTYNNGAGVGALAQQFTNGVVSYKGTVPTQSGLCLETVASGAQAQWGTCAAGASAVYSVTGSTTTSGITVTTTNPSQGVYNVAVNQNAAPTQNAYDASSAVTNDQTAQAMIQRSMATMPMNLGTTASGVYSFASYGTGFVGSFNAASGAITTNTVVYNGGLNYKVGDLLTVNGSGNSGNQDSVLAVTSVGASGVVNSPLKVIYGGTGYTSGTNIAGDLQASFPYTFNITGTLTGATTILVTPGTYLTQSNQWDACNNTTGAYSLIFKMSAQSSGVSTDTAMGTGAIIPQGSNNSQCVNIQTDGQSDIWIVPAVVPGSGVAAITATIALSNGASSGVGTLTNAPASSNPTKWIQINDGGTIRYIPAW